MNSVLFPSSIKTGSKKTLAAAAFLILFLSIIEVQAKERLFFVGIDGGITMECIDESHSKDAMKLPIDVSFDDSWGVKLRGGMDVNEWVSLEAMLEYIRPFKDTEEGKDNQLDVIDLFGNAKLILSYSGSFMPYFLAGGGVWYTKEDIVYRNRDYEKIRWGLAGRIGMGTEIFLTPYTALCLEVDHVFPVLGDTDYIRFTNLSLGLHLYF